MPDRLRLAELLGGLSIVADLGYSLPPGEALRACVLGTKLADACGLSDSEMSHTFYTALLRHIGCTGFAHEGYKAVGDDLQGNAASQRTNFADVKSIMSTMIPEATRGQAPLARARVAARMMAGGPKIGKTLETASCEVARSTARRIGLSGGVQQSLHEVMEWWNGKGNPDGLEGEDIARSARVARVACEAVVFQRLGGSEMVVDELQKRSGSVLDPNIVDLCLDDQAGLFDDSPDADPREQILEVEPRPVVEIGSDQLVGVAEAFADLIDLKAPFMQGHSRGVATLARAAAPAVGLDDAATEDLYIAALLHDLGRAGVSNRVWEKPGPLTSIEWEEVRMHSYHSERILSTSPTLEHLAPIAAMHHERLDGSGYHRGSHGRDLAMSARVLACADAFYAMTEWRPYRDAMSSEQAAAELAQDARAGRLDPDAATAVIDAAGQDHVHLQPDSWPAGLSDREVDVLRLSAEGCSNPEIGERLHISRRTAEHHLQHVYTKIGTSSRAAAALFALEHNLLTPDR